jgi:hypothetical protein
MAERGSIINKIINLQRIVKDRLLCAGIAQQTSCIYPLYEHKARKQALFQTIILSLSQNKKRTKNGSLFVLGEIRCSYVKSTCVCLTRKIDQTELSVTDRKYSLGLPRGKGYRSKFGPLVLIETSKEEYFLVDADSDAFQIDV